MKVLCVIPARLESTRLPRKMLQDLAGKPMIQRTYEGARDCNDIDRVIVATDSDEIASVINNLGGEALLTPKHLQTGSDRVAFVAKEYPDYDVVINLQGDEPFIKTTMLSELLTPYLSGEMPEMATLAFDLLEGEAENPNFVKVITDLNDTALYFSRSAIPYPRTQQATVPVYHHMGLYAFKREFLLEYTQLPKTPLEMTESLEQLRAIEHGHRIKVVYTKSRTLEINTKEELEIARGLLIAS